MPKYLPPAGPTFPTRLFWPKHLPYPWLSLANSILRDRFYHHVYVTRNSSSVAEFAVGSPETAVNHEVTLCLEWTLEPCQGSNGQSLYWPRRRPGFKPRPVHVGFIMDRVSRGHVSLRARRFSPPISDAI